MGGASYLDLLTMAELSISSLYGIIDNILPSIDLSIEILPTFEYLTSFSEAREGFSRKLRSKFRVCVGLLDGLEIKYYFLVQQKTLFSF